MLTPSDAAPLGLQAQRAVPLKVLYPAGFAIEYNVLPVDPVETAREAIATITRRLGLATPDLMGLYTVCAGHCMCSGRAHKGHGAVFLLAASMHPRPDRVLPLDMYVQDAVHELYQEAARQHLDVRDETVCRLEFRKKVFLDVDDEEDHWAVRMFMACQVHGRTIGGPRGRVLRTHGQGIGHASSGVGG